MSQYILEASKVAKDFKVYKGLFQDRENIKAVDTVSLKIKKGEILGIVGESGCGKTTMAKMLLGLLRPDSGFVQIKGQDINAISRLQLAKLVQPIFQDPYSSLNPRKTIGSIMSLPLRVQKKTSQNDLRKLILKTMDLVGLPSRMIDHYPNQLSGGQRQRVAIGRALINRPEIIICDEPTSALDVSVQSQILNLLNALRDELNLTYVLISHNLAVVEHMATKVAVMYFGKKVEEADTDSIFSSPKDDYTKKLLNSILLPNPKESFF